MTNFQKVKQFMEIFGQEVVEQPKLPHYSVGDLRLSLIEEEVDELHFALQDKNLVEIADALTDILYVTYGAGHAFGINLDACLEEVHRSNMTKLGPDGKPIYREDGKVLKGENYEEPKLEDVM